MGKPKKSSTFLNRFKYVLIGISSGVILTLFGLAALYFFPVTLPIIGVTLAAASLELMTGMTILASFVISALIGGGLGKLIELVFSGDKNMMRMKINFNFRVALLPVVGMVASAVSSVFGKPGPSKAIIRGEGVELNTFDSDAKSSSEDFTSSPELSSGHENIEDDHVERITLNILDEISHIKKESGWPRKVKELREKLLIGNESKILDELQNHEKELKIKFIVKILLLDQTAMKKVFDEFFALKLKVLLHPNQSMDQSAENSALHDQISREFLDWFDKIEDALTDPDDLEDVLRYCREDKLLRKLYSQDCELDELLSQMLTIVTEINQRLRSLIKDMENTIAVVQGTTTEVRDFLVVAKPEVREIKQILDGLESSMVKREEKLNSSVYWDEVRREIQSEIKETMRGFSQPSQQFSRTFSLPRLSVTRQSLFLRRHHTQQPGQPLLLLKDREEADKENTTPRATVN